MKLKPALTLIELLIVMALIGILTSLGAIYLSSMRNNQSLISSTDYFKSVLSRAHIYARESRDEKSWGVKNQGNASYILMSGSKTNNVVEASYNLEQPIEFQNGNFEVWFEVGTGDADNSKDIRLSNPQGKIIKIEINKNGLINTVNI